MDFAFSDDQVAIRDTARRFAMDRLAPLYRQREQMAKLAAMLSVKWVNWV